MEGHLFCALVLLAALGGVAAAVEKVQRKDTFQSLEQIGEVDFFSPDEIWLDGELSFSDSTLLAYLDNDKVEGIDWSAPMDGVGWDISIITIILLAAEIVCLGLCLYHPKFRHFLRSCCIQCYQWWRQYLCVPLVTRVLNIPQAYRDCKCRAPPLSASAVLQVLLASCSSSKAASDGTTGKEGVHLLPVISEDRAHHTSHHIPDNMGDNIV